MTRDEKENWKKTRRFILDRDRQTCQRCDKHFRAQRDLSVHHIVPRADGGSDDPSNLVTLCQSCHDYAEMNGLKTLAEIIGSFEDKTVEVYKKADEQIETFARPDWHAWVYGGARNPQLDEMKERK